MRPALFSRVLSFAEARRLTIEAATAQPVGGIETLPLDVLDGRVAAIDVVAADDVPGFDRAAMDGYAVVAEDTRGATPEAPRALACVGALYTGEWPDITLTAGRCVEIATGAPLPPGATAVVMVEQTTRAGEQVLVHQPVAPGQHVGRRGADMRAGARIISAGDLLTPGRVGVVAGAGLTSLAVYAQPSVAVISTGNEVVLPGQPLGPGQVHNINRFTLSAVIRRHGGVPVPLPVAADSIEALDRAIDGITAHDVAVFSGGSSVGRRDLMLDALRARGEILYHGIAVKPGKPTLLARIGRTLVMGMPGYPTSCLSNAYLLLVPLLRTIARLPEWIPETRRVRLAGRAVSTRDRHQFYPVRIVGDRAEPVFKGSGEITSLANADGYVEIPEGVDAVDAGTDVTVTLLG
ncbi:MAG: molybdenum cofactor biosynthesis protein [Acidobacteria bacterium]|nr:molybdenum cofactor biosynthesis protein [Acidobacteriota bacterium]